MTQLHLLTIDDNRVEHKILVQQLMLMDFDVKLSSCYDGREALEFLANCSEEFVDLIFTDVNMPLVSGPDFLAQYQAEYYPRFPQTPVYLLTSSAEAKDAELADTFPCVTGYILKPLLLDPLTTLLETVLNQKREQGQS